MRWRSEGGSALVIAILTIVALFALGAALAFLTRTDVNISKHQTLHSEALYVAEAGVEEALHRMSLTDPTNIDVNGGTINAAIWDDSLPYDPDWRYSIFLCAPGAEPATPAGEDYTVTIQDAGTWLEYSSPDNANLALTIEHKWKDLDDDGLREDGEIVRYDPTQHPPENFTDGRPVELITVVGKSATAERIIKVEATRFPFTANVLAALMCDMGIDIRGNVTVCGHDHAMAVPHYTMYPNCQAWEWCGGSPGGSPACQAAGCLIGAMTTGDDIDRVGTTDVSGNPTPVDTSSSNHFLTLAEALGLSQDELNTLLSNPDYTAPDVASPQDGITYINNAGGAMAKWTGGGVGSGLIYVTGDFETGGNFMWKGLIYVEGDYSITGTPSVVGAIIVKGVSEYAFSGGNPCILYSSEAINESIAKHVGYIRIGWKEVSGQ
jgi:hypothetical protein